MLTHRIEQGARNIVFIDRLREQSAVAFFPHLPVLCEKFPSVNFGPPVDKNLDLWKYPSHQVGAGIEIIEKVPPDVIALEKINGFVGVTAQGNPAELTFTFILVKIIIPLKGEDLRELKKPHQKQQFYDR